MILGHDFPLALTVTDRESMDYQLDVAVRAAEQNALMGGRQGILVTRHSMDSFTVALSDAVPFGVTRELRAW